MGVEMREVRMSPDGNFAAVKVGDNAWLITGLVKYRSNEEVADWLPLRAADRAAVAIKANRAERRGVPLCELRPGMDVQHPHGQRRWMRLERLLSMNRTARCWRVRFFASGEPANIWLYEMEDGSGYRVRERASA